VVKQPVEGETDAPQLKRREEKRKAKAEGEEAVKVPRKNYRQV